MFTFKIQINLIDTFLYRQGKHVNLFKISYDFCRISKSEPQLIIDRYAPIYGIETTTKARQFVLSEFRAFRLNLVKYK